LEHLCTALENSFKSCKFFSWKKFIEKSNTLTQEPGWSSQYSDSLRAGRSRDLIPVEAIFPTVGQTQPPKQ